MTALSEGNGLNYRSYFGITSNQPIGKKIEDAGAVVNAIKVEKSEAPSNVEQQNAAETEEDSTPVLDIVINNVVCSFNVRCHLNLKHIALNGSNVEYKREFGMVTMKLRHPSATATIWSSGKITCTGATSDTDAKKASRRFARMIQQLGFRAKFTNFRVVNVLGTCTMPFAIKITQFSATHPRQASYEPELHPGVTYKITDFKATLKIFSTGSITITAPSIENVQRAVEHIFPLVYEFRKERPPKPSSVCAGRNIRQLPYHTKEEVEMSDYSDEDDDEEIDVCESDASWN